MKKVFVILFGIGAITFSSCNGGGSAGDDQTRTETRQDGGREDGAHDDTLHNGARQQEGYGQEGEMDGDNGTARGGREGSGTRQPGAEDQGQQPGTREPGQQPGGGAEQDDGAGQPGAGGGTGGADQPGGGAGTR
ncbi:MAG: hypothetical protein ACK4ND_19360 [Cytophagaceae bacterium]